MLPEPDVDGEVVAVGLVVGFAGVVVQATWTAGATNGRKFSFAAWPRLARFASLPGIETTSWSLPWITTVASVTPVPLTRSVMICLACDMLELDDGVCPCWCHRREYHLGAADQVDT